MLWWFLWKFWHELLPTILLANVKRKLCVNVPKNLKQLFVMYMWVGYEYKIIYSSLLCVECLERYEMICCHCFGDKNLRKIWWDKAVCIVLTKRDYVYLIGSIEKFFGYCFGYLCTSVFFVGTKSNNDDTQWVFVYFFVLISWELEISFVNSCIQLYFVHIVCM